MKKHLLGIFAVPVALLVMAGGLATSSATGEPAAGRKPVKGVFVYDRNAPAEVIYAKLHRTAQRLCGYTGRPELIQKHDDSCVASVTESGVRRIGRTDIALIHSRMQG